MTTHPLLLTRRVILAGTLCWLTARPLRAAETPPANSSEYRRVSKAAWCWRLHLDDLIQMPEVVPQQGLTRILLSLSKPVLAALEGGDAETLAALRILKGRGVAIVALVGDHRWVRGWLHDAHEPILPSDILSALAIQQRIGLFDALHFDVEPHVLPEWHSSSRDALAQAYVSFMAAISKAVPNLPIEAAVHPIYANIGVAGGGTMLSSLAALVSEVSIMAYRDHPAEAVRFATDAIRVVESSGMNWRFGVLTHPDHPATISYAGTTAAEFMREMTLLDGMLKQRSPSGHYQGLIFEDYLSLLKIFSDQPP